MSPVLGSAIEMEKTIVRIEVNFVVDTVWNYLVLLNLPKDNDFSLSSNLQNILNKILNPTTFSDFSTSAHDLLDPITNSLTDMNIDLNGISPLLKSISTAGKYYGIFNIIFNLGGEQEVEWSIEAISTRIFDHLTNWLDHSSPNLSATDNFVNTHYDNSYENEILSFANQGSTVQSSMNSLAYDLLGLSPSQTPSDYPLNSGNIIIPATIGTSLSATFIDYLGEELSSLGSGLQGGLQDLALLGKVGIAVAGAAVTYWAFASIDLIGYLITNDLENSFSVANLPNILIADVESSQQILFFPQTSYDKVLSDIVWIQASKMSNDVFSFIKMMNFAGDPGWFLALQFAQTCVFSLGAFYFTQTLNVDKAQLYGQSFQDIWSSSIDILLNYVSSIISLLTNLILYSASAAMYMGYNINSLYLNFLRLFSIGFSIFYQFYLYNQRHHLSLDDINLYKRLITDKSLDTTILFTQIAGYTLSTVLTTYKLVDKIPDPKVTLIATFASWQSYIVQFNTMIIDTLQ